MKKLLITWSILLLFSFFTTTALSQCTVYYCDGCVRNGLCPVSQTFATRGEAEQSANYACPGGGCRVVCNGEEHKPMIISPVSFGFTFGILGALGTSFTNDANGKNQWDGGAAGGLGFGLILGELLKPKKRSLVASIAINSIAGAALGYAEAKREIFNKPANSASQNITLERERAGEGAAVVGVLGVVVTVATTGFHKPTLGSSSLIRKSNFLSNMAFTMSGNRIGVMIRL